MLTEERQAEIMRIVNVHGAVSVQELVNYLDISESTVRRDLAALDEEGLLRRVHGGATSLKEGAHDAAMEDLQDKYSLHIGEKRRIAQFAASLVRPDDFVYLDGGSTVEHFNANRATGGVTIGFAPRLLKCELHLNYEHYFLANASEQVLADPRFHNKVMVELFLTF